MRPRQPVAQQTRRFHRRRSVKRHQRGRDARESGRCRRASDPARRARPRSDRGVLRWILRSDEQQRSRWSEKNFVVVGSGQFYASACSDQAKRSHESAHRARIARDFRRARQKKNSSCRSMHRKLTNHPQVFHSLDLYRARTLRLKLHVQPYGWRPRSARSLSSFRSARREPPRPTMPRCSACF